MNKLENLLKLNKHIRIELKSESEKSYKEKYIYRLNVFYHHTLIDSSIFFESNKIEAHADPIYDHIINLHQITLYIPKIYIRENQ